MYHYIHHTTSAILIESELLVTKALVFRPKCRWCYGQKPSNQHDLRNVVIIRWQLDTQYLTMIS